MIINFNKNIIKNTIFSLLLMNNLSYGQEVNDFETMNVIKDGMQKNNIVADSVKNISSKTFSIDNLKLYATNENNGTQLTAKNIIINQLQEFSSYLKFANLSIKNLDLSLYNYNFTLDSLDALNSLISINNESGVFTQWSKLDIENLNIKTNNLETFSNVSIKSNIIDWNNKFPYPKNGDIEINGFINLKNISKNEEIILNTTNDKEKFKITIKIRTNLNSINTDVSINTENIGSYLFNIELNNVENEFWTNAKNYLLQKYDNIEAENYQRYLFRTSARKIEINKAIFIGRNFNNLQKIVDDNIFKNKLKEILLYIFNEEIINKYNTIINNMDSKKDYTFGVYFTPKIRYTFPEYYKRDFSSIKNEKEIGIIVKENN